MTATRTFLCVLVVSLLSVLTAEAGDPPVREPLPFPDMTGQFCEHFSVFIHALVNRNFITVHDDGPAHISGTLILEVTNVNIGKSIVDCV